MDTVVFFRGPFSSVSKLASTGTFPPFLRLSSLFESPSLFRMLLSPVWPSKRWSVCVCVCVCVLSFLTRVSEFHQWMGGCPCLCELVIVFSFSLSL